VGTDPLFFVYLGSSVLTFLLAGLTYLLVDRFSRRWIFFLSFEGFAAVILALWWLLGHSAAAWPVFAARILSDVFFVLALLEFWLLTGDYFTNLEGRWRFPLFVAAGGLGYMLGSVLLEAYAQRFEALNFFLLWGGILGVLPVLLLFLFKPASLSPAPPDISAAEAEPKSSDETPASAVPLLKTLLLFWLAFTFLSCGVDYFFNTAALNFIPDENQLAAFFGKVAFFSLLAVLFFQLFIAPRLAMAFSVDRSLLLFCFLLLLGCALVAWDPSLAGVAVSEGLVIYFLDSKAVALLQPVENLFPDRFRGRAKVALDGFAPSSGDLLLLATAFGLSWTVGLDALAYVLVGGAALFLSFPLLFRRTYLRYLTDCLRARDPKLVLDAVQALGEKDKTPATDALLQLLETSSDIYLKRNILITLGRMRSPAALPAVIRHFSIPNEALQLAVIQALGHYRNFPGLFALYELMKSQDNVSFQVRMSATLLMTRLVGKRMIPLLKEAL
ncbi:MAG: HEAT repeat domain-containing protein, partial [Candidatus Binatia bacterium]